MNITKQVQKCVRPYTRIWNIDVVIYEDDSQKSHCTPTLETHSCGVEMQKSIFGTAGEMKKLLEHYRNRPEYKISKNPSRGVHGEACYSIRER